MADAKTPVEHELTMICARTAKAGLQAATAERQSRQADEALKIARAEAVKAIVATMPLLTAEQREQLRPILAGTIPADAGCAGETAA